MAPSFSNDLDSPVSLLWAHQLRKEHATIVAQLEELKALHPSASELKKLVSRTEKTEAATNKIRKDLADLKTAHQKSVKRISGLGDDVRALQNVRAEDVAVRQENNESFRHETEALGQALRLQESEVARAADALEKVRGLAEERYVVMEEKLLQREDEIGELRSLIQALQQRIEAGVTVVRDSVDCPKTTEAPKAPPDHISEADSFDLDANMLTVTAAPSGPVLGPSLAMIKERTLLRHSQRLGNQRQSSVDDSLQMLPEQSVPPPPKQRRNSNASTKSIRQADIKLEQGTSNLATYIQIADSQYREISPSEKEPFVDAFIRGLRNKREKKKCEKKLKGARKTWDNLKDCFPIASQQSQSNANSSRPEQGEHLHQKKPAAARTRRRGSPILPSGEERGEVETETTRRGRPNPPPILPPNTSTDQAERTSRGAARNAVTRLHEAAEQTALTERDQHHPGRVVLQRGSIENNEHGRRRPPLLMTPPAPATPAAAPVVVVGKKRTLGEQHAGEVIVPREVIAPAVVKKRRIAKGERRRERPPSIPILPSSDDEFA